MAYTCDPSDLAVKDHAYQVCKNSSVCTKLFQLNGGGTDTTMWNFLIVHNGGSVPESGGCLLDKFNDEMDTDQKKDFMLLSYMISHGVDTPPCPYDMVYEIDDATGSRSCVCPMGVSCRPPCSDKTLWVNACIACAAIVAVCTTIRMLLTPSNIVR